MSGGKGSQAVIAMRQAAVRRAEAYVCAHLDAPIPLSELCRIVGLSERGLRNGFHGVHGMGPKRWLLTERLVRAQTALSKPRNVALTVTAVAADHGFYQLGRFAGVYRERFGETPSETLRAAARAGPALPPKRSQGDGNACTRA